MKTQRYIYHDAVVVNASINEALFCLLVDLYSFYYPLKPRVAFLFRLPKDNQICEKWVKSLTEESEDHDYFGERIDSLEIIGTENKFYTCKITFNNMQNLSFKCSDFEETEINNNQRI